MASIHATDVDPPLCYHTGLCSAAKHRGAPECKMIVDSGYSFTHVVPLMSGKVLWQSARRRVWFAPGMRSRPSESAQLTDADELLSFRQYDLMGETYITKSNPSKIVQEYIFPRYSENRPGRLKTQEDVLIGEDDVLRMNTERFAVGGASIQAQTRQAGLSHTAADVISSLPEDMQELFWTNVGFIGGNVRLPGFRNRLMTELRSLAPAEHEVRIYESSNPIIAAYLAGAEFALQPGFANVCVTRAEYQEARSRTYRRKFKYATWQVREVGERTPQGPGKDTGNNAGLARSRTRSRGSKTQGDVGDSRAERKPLRSSRSGAANNKA